MKKYLVFYYYGYYPTGGMEDYIGQVNTIDELVAFIESLDSYTKTSIECGDAYLQVADMVNMKFKEFEKVPTREDLSDFESYKQITPVIETN